MKQEIYDLIYKLETSHSLSLSEYQLLIEGRDEEAASLLREKAVSLRKKNGSYPFSPYLCHEFPNNGIWHRINQRIHINYFNCS